MSGTCRGLQLLEDRPHLRRLHPLLVVVEQDVVGLVRRLEAVDVGELQLDVPLEVRQEPPEVGLGPRLDPGGLGERRGASHLGLEVGGHPQRLVEVSACHPDQAGLVGARVEALLVRAQLLEQLADPVLGEPLVRDSAQRRELLRPGLRAAARHHRLLVPAEQPGRPAQVADLCETCLQILVALVHRCWDIVEPRRDGSGDAAAMLTPCAASRPGRSP